METSTLRKPALLTLALLAIFALSTLACSISGIPFDSKSATIDITLRQDDLDLFFDNDNVNSDTHDPLLKEVKDIEIHDGFVRVFGIAETPQGDEVRGSYDASLSAEDGALSAQIIAVDIEGVNIDDPRVIETNQEIADALARSVREHNGEVLFQEVDLREGALKMKIKVNFKND